MKSFLLPIQKLLQHFLFGRHCAGCKAPGTALCERCFTRIPPAEATEHAHIYGMVTYAHPLVHDALWGLKYHHRGTVAQAITKYCGPIVQELIADILIDTEHSTVVFVPIPQYKDKQHTRGFNQSAAIAAWLSENTDIPVKDLLEKKYHTTPQAKIQKRMDRFYNIAGVFTIKDTVTVQENTLYVLIDDVTTTGATLLEGMNAFKKAGALHVIGIALAHGYKNCGTGEIRTLGRV